MNDRHILILGGTRQAMQLAEQLRDDGSCFITLSLLGLTQAIIPKDIHLRQGAFGGVDGLVAYMRDHRVAALVDATHPFAERMSHHAVLAAAKAGIPRLSLTRPPWRAKTDDRWILCRDKREVVAHLRLYLHPHHSADNLSGRIFLSLGGRGASLWMEDLADMPCLVRFLGEFPPPPLPSSWRWVKGAPSDATKERLFLKEHDVSVLVSRNSGGAESYGKIEAARLLGLEVIMIESPPLPPPPCVIHLHEAVAWCLSLGAKDVAMGGII